MNNAHFFLVIEDHMQLQIRYFVKSLELFAGLDDFYVTLMIPENQRIEDRYLIKNCEIFTYKNEMNLSPKWSGAVRYFLEPKATTCFMVDADILIVDKISDIVQKINLNKKIYGALAYSNPFSKKYWNYLLKEFNLDYSEDEFLIHIENKEESSPSCYFNYGFVGLHKDLMLGLAPHVEKFIFAINKKIINYKGQVALCLAIINSKISYENFDYRYNFGMHLSKSMFISNGLTNEYYSDLIRDLRVFHYCKDKNLILNKKSEIDKVQYCIKRCSEPNKLYK